MNDFFMEGGGEGVFKITTRRIYGVLMRNFLIR